MQLLLLQLRSIRQLVIFLFENKIIIVDAEYQLRNNYAPLFVKSKTTYMYSQLKGPIKPKPKKKIPKG